MFSRKRMLEILCVSLLLAIVLIISFFNLISDEPGNENFAATFIFIALFILATVIAYLLRDKAVVLFIFVYFSLMTLCVLTALIFSLTGGEYNIFILICSIFFSPFYGFVYISDFWIAVALASNVVITAVSGLLFLQLSRKEREEKKNSEITHQK